MRHILFWTFFLSSLPLLLSQQVCKLSFPLSIPSNDSITYSLEVHGVTKNDLSLPGQGLCAVNLKFRHSSIYDFEVWLISPAGQEVQLIGPNSTVPKDPDYGAQFDVQFLPCPDINSGNTYPTWDNQTLTFGFSNTGEYVPFQGCLQDFNMGSVDGTWTIKLKTEPTPFYSFPNMLLNFELVFCDELGRNCCFADAGTLPRTDMLRTCSRSEELDLRTIAPLYSGQAPDTAEYAYTWAICRDSALVAWATQPDLRTYPGGNYQLLGVSYAKADSTLLPLPDTTLRFDQLRDSLSSVTPPFCGKMTTDFLPIEIMPSPDTVFIDTSICRSNYVYVFGKPYYDPDKYILTGKAANGCDSIVVLDLHFKPPVYGTLDTTICDQDSLVISQNIYFKTPGIHTATLESAEGCDSILTINLTVIPTPTKTIDAYICIGGQITIAGKVLKTAGIHRIRKPAPTGCDSLIVVNLQILKPSALIAPPKVITCDRPEVELDARASKPVGNITFIWSINTIPLTGDSILKVRTPGNYELRVKQTVDTVFCIARTTVDVFADLSTPDILVSGIDTLNCLRQATTLSVRNQTSATDISYLWQEATRPLTPADTNTTYIARQGGIYSVIAKDRSSGCRDTAILKVSADTARPAIYTGPTQTLTCTRTNVTLGNPNAPLNNLRYAWTLSGLSSNPSLNQPSLTIQEPGTWKLSVESLQNGCISKDSVLVQRDTLHPVAEAGATRRITCGQPIATLNGSASSTGSRYIYQWIATDGGNIASGKTTLNPQIDAAGLYLLTVQDTLNGCTATDSVRTAAALEKPDIPFIRDGVLNCRDTIVYLQATLPDSRAYSYRWFGSASQNVPNELTFLARSSGIYTFELTDSETGCSNTAQVQVNQDTIRPALDAGKTEIFRCNQTEIQLNGTTNLSSGRYRAQWTSTDGAILSGGRTLTPVASGPGLYTLTLEDIQNACTASDTIRVVADTRFPSASAGKDTLLTCEHPSIRLSGMTNLASWAFDCAWTTPNGRISSDATRLNPLVDRPGTYYLSVTDKTNGCAGMDTVVVTENKAQPKAQISPAIQNFLLTCLHDTILLDASLSASANGTPLTYLWRSLTSGGFTPGSKPEQILVSLPSIYQLVVQDQLNGCKDTLEVPIEADFNPPIIQVSAPDVLTCNRNNVEVIVKVSSGDASVRFQWKNPDGQFITNNAATLIATQPGQYQTIVTNLKNGCVAEGSAQVRENRTAPNITFAPVESLDCDTRVVQLGATSEGGSSRLQFSWSTQEGAFAAPPKGSIAQAILSGWYIMQVENPENGCSAKDSILVTERANAIDSVHFLVTAPGCSSSLPGTLEVTKVFGGLPPYRYEFNQAPSANGVFGGLLSGTYTLKTTDSEGCSWSSQVEIPQPRRISVDLGPDRQLIQGDSIRLDARVFPPTDGLLFQWVGVEGLAGTSGDFQVVTPYRSTTFEVRVTAPNKCTASDQVRIQVVQDVPLFIPNVFSPNGDGHNDVFYVQSGTNGYRTIRRMQVFDRSGALVFSRENVQTDDPTMGWNGQVRNQGPRAGVYVYFIQVLGPDGQDILFKGDITLMH